MKKLTTTLKSIPFGIALLASLVSCVGFLDAEAMNKDRAEIIINALYEFEQSNSRFPDALEELVPEFLDSVPVTINGDDFLYRANSVDGFYIFFEVRSHYGCSFSDQDRQWECSGGGD